MTDNITPQVSHDIDPLDVAAFFMSEDRKEAKPGMTPLKLHKLLYFAQANYLASTGFRLFDAEIEAWKHGPVVPSVRPEFMGSKIISAKEHAEVARRWVPKDVASFLQQIWKLYGSASVSKLLNIAHSQSPWKDHFEPGVMHSLIPDESMASYFRDHVDREHRVFHPDVVVIDRSFLDDLDDREDAIVAQLQSTLHRHRPPGHGSFRSRPSTTSPASPAASRRSIPGSKHTHTPSGGSVCTCVSPRGPKSSRSMH